MNNDASLRSIVEKSAFLYERATRRFVAEPPGEAGLQIARDRLAAWREQAARGEAPYFEKRLSWDGLDLASAERLSGEVRLHESEPLPGWAGYLAAILAGSSSLRSASPVQLEQTFSRLPYLSASDPVPFEHVLVPFVEHASERLQNEAGARWALLSPDAQVRLQRHLLKTLSWIAGETLNLEFSIWRAMPEREFLPPADGLNSGRRLYGGFVRKMWADGLLRLCNEYPVLARFMARTSELWVSCFASFLSHLTEDLPELEKLFNDGKPLGRIEKVEPGLSDRHSLGKTVLEITFQAGPVCFYKPRNCKSESDYNTVVEWLNRHGSPLQFRTYRLLQRNNHGWAEKVWDRPCLDEDELRRYFQRSGMLLALLYALQASDCNYENIVPQGEYPVLIDTETILQPRPRLFDTNTWGAMEEANRAVSYDSVFRLSFLPRWIARPDGDKMDMSGFGPSMGRGYVKKKSWININSDEMTLAWERALLVGNVRGVRLGDQLVNASDYMEEIISGFEQMYRLLIKVRGDLWSAGGPLSGMRGFGTRFIFRNTFTYSGVLNNCLSPLKLRDGMDTSICVDVLARRFAHSAEDKPLVWPAMAAEHASLLDLDIPRFEAPTDSDALQIGPGQFIDGYFMEPGISILKAKFDGLSEEDLDLQTRYIRCAFACFNSSQCSVETPVEADLADGDAADVEVFSAQALSIARQIREKSIRTSDGTTSWISQVYNMDSQFWQLQPMGLYFYDGVCGIALFLAALERVTGSDEFRDLTNSVLKVLEHFSSERMRDFLEREGIGAGIGTSSLVYVLLRTGSLLQDERLASSAGRIARLITKKQIYADRRLDMIGGAAGCLAVLCALYRVTPEPWVLERAVLCGDHLLETRSAAPSRLRSWATIQGKFLAGFSHGAAGMIYALSQLYELTSDERYRKAAAEAQAYEDSLFDEEKQNWPNLLLPLKDGGFDFWNSWCHGAPGIGLSRLGSSSCLDSAALNTDVGRALASAAKRQLHESDFPCCGNLGRIEVLAQAAQKLGRADCLRQARVLGHLVVRRAGQNGRYAVGIRNGIYIPSFHQGMAGVGYQLLRLAKPEQVPSALCWE